MCSRAIKSVALLSVLLLLTAACGRDGDETGARFEERIVIGWTPPVITGGCATATEFFVASA
jgi:hypothetical protein